VNILLHTALSTARLTFTGIVLSHSNAPAITEHDQHLSTLITNWRTQS